MRTSTVAFALAGLLLASEAHAQIAIMAAGRGYFGVSAGVFIPQDLHSSVSGPGGGSFDLSFKTGSAFTGFAGYHFTDQLAAEAELGYATADTDQVSSGAIAANVGGHVNSVLGFGNVLWKPMGYRGLSPYLGGGVGFASTDLSINSVAGTPVASSGSETDFAGQLIAGLDFPLGDRFAIGGRYRFVWINTGSTVSAGVNTIKQDDFTAHVLTVTGTFRF